MVFHGEVERDLGCDEILTLHEAARSLGFETGTCRRPDDDWLKISLPVIAFESQVSAGGDPPVKLVASAVLIIQASPGHLLDFPFLLIFLAVMFAYGWQLSLIAVGLLSVIALISFLVAPLFRERLNRQFMLGARNQAFLTEYICGMGTVKSLQMEPDIDRKYGDLLAQCGVMENEKRGAATASGFNANRSVRGLNCRAAMSNYGLEVLA